MNKKMKNEIPTHMKQQINIDVVSGQHSTSIPIFHGMFCLIENEEQRITNVIAELIEVDDHYNYLNLDCDNEELKLKLVSGISRKHQNVEFKTRKLKAGYDFGFNLRVKNFEVC